MQYITIENAYEGNLKHISMRISRNQLICVMLYEERSGY